MAKVIKIGGITKLDIPIASVVDGIPNDMKNIVVLGFKEDGSEYFASSVSDGAEVLWLLERAKHRLMSIVDDS